MNEDMRWKESEVGKRRFGGVRKENREEGGKRGGGK